MVVAVLGPVSVGSCFCHQSKHSSVGDVVVLLPSPLVSPVARIRRSARVSPWSKPEVGDDKWDPGVSDCVVQNEFSVFQI